MATTTNINVGDTVSLKGGMGKPMLVAGFGQETVSAQVISPIAGGTIVGDPTTKVTMPTVQCLWFGPDDSVRTHEFQLALIDLASVKSNTPVVAGAPQQGLPVGKAA